MLISISMHKRDSKGTMKFNFVTSYLAFRGLIPTPKARAFTKVKHKPRAHMQFYKIQ